MLAQGLNDCEIARATGIPRGTVRTWRISPGRGPCSHQVKPNHCPVCGDGDLDQAAYAYLLALYLGDGCINEVKENVFKLRITLDLKYPGIIEECMTAILAVRGAAAGKVLRVGCFEVYSYWKHWHCLFPQHGAGPKHHRRIELEDWQFVSTRAHLDLFLRGLIHSDGCRGINTVTNKTGRRYSYARYMFTNYSSDIRGIFCAACDDYGVGWRQMNWKTISIARRSDVEHLDQIIGPKR
jgi:hypothetical protein